MRSFHLFRSDVKPADAFKQTDQTPSLAVHNGPPERLIEQARGHTWVVEADDMQLERLKASSPVISTIPSTHGWEVQITGERPEGVDARPLEPSLEHAYVHFVENTLGKSWQDTA